MANYSDPKFEQQDDRIPDGEYRGFISSADFTPNKETSKGPADKFSIAIKIKSQPLVDRVVFMNRFVYDGNPKSALAASIMFSQFAKLGVDVKSFLKANNMNGLMDALRGKWLVFEAKTKGDYQNLNIKSLYAGGQTPVTADGARASDALNFPPPQVQEEYGDYPTEDAQPGVDDMPF